MAFRSVPTLAIAGLALGLAGCAAPAPPPRRGALAAPEAPAPDPSKILAGLVDAHNQARARAGLPPLAVDPRLDAAARRHADDMAARRRMTHRGGDGSSPFQRIEAEGYHFRQAAENIAFGRFTLDSLMRGWLGSPGHRRNILGNFSEIGAAYATAGDGTAYWCVTFGELWGR